MTRESAYKVTYKKRSIPAVVFRLAVVIGGLSNPAKMPCYGFSIPAIYCKVGSKLRNVANSVCAICYAMGGFYLMPVVAAAMERRYQIMMQALDVWKRNMILVLAELNRLRPSDDIGTFFRWHDSGDIQSVEHLESIAEIARAIPAMAFWLPTKEIAFLEAFRLRHGNDSIPENLTIRLSVSTIGMAPSGLIDHITSKMPQVASSGVRTKEQDGNGELCSAYDNDGFCNYCRRCWDASIPHIDYPAH